MTTEANGADPAAAPEAPQIVDEPTLEISPAEAAARIEGGADLIDVRRDHEFEAAHIPGARRVGLENVQSEAATLPKDKPILLYCKTGNRSGMAAEALQAAGFDAHSIDGGITGWRDAGQPLDPADGKIVESGEAAAILESQGRFPVDKVEPPPDEVV